MSDRGQKTGKIWITLLLLVTILGLTIWLKENTGFFKKGRPVIAVDDPAAVEAVRANRTKLLVIGIDGATWSIIADLSGQGKLPNLRKLLEQGSRGTLHSEAPMISPALWTTMATGVSRSKHKIDNFVFKPVKGYAPEALDSRVRAAPALWEILGHYGKKVAVINWNSAAPAEPVNGIFIADGAKRNDLGAENVYPADWIPRLKDLPLIRVDWFEEKLKKWNHTMPTKGYAEDTFVASAGAEILQKEKPDLMLIYFRNVDVASHLFWKYRWPIGLEYQFPVSQADQERFGDLIENYYELLDALIGKLIEAGPDYTVMIVSDHGEAATYSPKNIFVELNVLLHELGFLDYKAPRCEDTLKKMNAENLYQAPDPAKDIFFDCETLRHAQISGPPNLAAWLISKRRIAPEKTGAAAPFIGELYDSLSHPQLAKEINWPKTRLFNIDDFHKDIRGIYINLKDRDPEGVIGFKDYSSFRKQAVALLSALENEKGEKLFKKVKANPEQKGPVAKGIIAPPDILVEFNPQVLYGQYLLRQKGDPAPILISSILWSYQDVSGDHVPEGIIIVSGPAAAPGIQISASIYEVAPTILWRFDAPVARDMPGQILESAFKTADRTIRYVSSYQGAIKIPVSFKPKGIGQEDQERLKAVGYLK